MSDILVVVDKSRRIIFLQLVAKDAILEISKLNIDNRDIKIDVDIVTSNILCVLFKLSEHNSFFGCLTAP